MKAKLIMLVATLGLWAAIFAGTWIAGGSPSIDQCPLQGTPACPFCH